MHSRTHAEKPPEIAVSLGLLFQQIRDRSQDAAFLRTYMSTNLLADTHLAAFRCLQESGWATTQVLPAYLHAMILSMSVTFLTLFLICKDKENACLTWVMKI